MNINSNISALNSYRLLDHYESQQAQSLGKISSGKRINSARDGAADLGIINKLQALVRGYNQVVRNAQDGISLLQKAEGGLSEIHAMLQRQRALVLKASNSVYTHGDLMLIKDELNQLTKQIDTIAKTTRFNTMNLLDGSLSVNGSGGSGGETPPVYNEWDHFNYEPAGHPDFDDVEIIINVPHSDQAFNLVTTVTGRKVVFNVTLAVEGGEIVSTPDEVRSAISAATVVEAQHSATGSINITSSGQGQTNAQFALWWENATDEVSFDLDINYQQVIGSGVAQSATITLPHDATAAMLQTQLNQKFSGSVNFVVSGQGTQADPYVVDVTGLANLPIGMGPPGTGAVNVTDSGASHTTASFNLWWEDIAGVNFDLHIYWRRLFGFLGEGTVAYETFNLPHDVTAAQLQNELNSRINEGDIAFTVSGQGTEANPFVVNISGLAYEWWGLGYDERIEILNFNRINPDYDESIALSNFHIEGGEDRPAVYGSQVVTFLPSGEPGEPDPPVEGSGILLHVGPRSSQSIFLSINSVTASSLDINDLTINNSVALQNSLQRIDAAIEQISIQRAGIGALQNRLENIININQVSMENMFSANSRIEDLDMAQGLLEFTKNNIMVTSGAAMLAHSNLRSEYILFLLENNQLASNKLTSNQLFSNHQLYNIQPGNNQKENQKQTAKSINLLLDTIV